MKRLKCRIGNHWWDETTVPNVHHSRERTCTRCGTLQWYVLVDIGRMKTWVTIGRLYS